MSASLSNAARIAVRTRYFIHNPIRIIFSTCGFTEGIVVFSFLRVIMTMHGVLSDDILMSLI